MTRMLCYLTLVIVMVTFTSGQQPRPCRELLMQSPSGQITEPEGFWSTTLVLPVNSFNTGWQITLRFSRPLISLSNQLTASSTNDNQQFVLRDSRANLPRGSNLSLSFTAHFSGDSPVYLQHVFFNGRLACNGSAAEDFDIALSPIVSPKISQAQSSTLRYDYAQVLNLSLLFYEAQRSGLLPEDNQIPWRGDSCVNDRAASGDDLSGGYYTNGRTTKYMFPNAAAMTVMAWGLITHDKGYEHAGRLYLARDALNWGATHLAKCYFSHNDDELYALIGDVNRELHLYWGRAEDIDFDRPALAVSRTKPGSELAAEMAAALAASSVALQQHVVNPSNPNEPANLYRSLARQLYEFAKNYRGDYSKAVPEAANSYKSWSGDEDELVWAALWLFRATSEERYRDEAQEMYQRFRLKDRNVMEFSWDEKTPGVRVLLSQVTLNPEYEVDAKKFCDMVKSSPNLHTPLGMFNVPSQNIGALRYSSNAAFVCFELGEALVLNGASTNPYLEFAMKQIHYVLGDTGRSFMVGFGENWPKFVHHSGASCPAKPASCGWGNYDSKQPNPNVLYGALVGGPDHNDNYTDARSNWQQNDVGIDYNAGFQSVVAGLLQLHHLNRLPNNAYV